MYDLSGHVLADIDELGRVVREYAYLDGYPLARFDYTKVRLASPAGSTAPVPTGGGTTASSSSGANPQVAVLQQVYFLLMLHSTSSTLYYLNDRLGTPQLLLNQTGHVVWQGEYHPFGRVDTVVNSTVSDFRFPGQRLDVETGLHYNAMRYYDPETGRYITTDPIGLAVGMNPYLYTGAEPVNWVDPWGLMTAGDVIRWAPIVFPIAPALPALAGTGVLGTGAVIGVGIIFYPSELDDSTLNRPMMANFPPGYWDAVKGAEEWGRRKGIGKDQGRRKFHKLKGSCNGSKANENYGVNPDTGDVVDGAGDWVGNLDD